MLHKELGLTLLKDLGYYLYFTCDCRSSVWNRQALRNTGLTAEGDGSEAELDIAALHYLQLWRRQDINCTTAFEDYA